VDSLKFDARLAVVASYEPREEGAEPGEASAKLRKRERLEPAKTGNDCGIVRSGLIL
jgi:hypothetical protein